MEPWRCCVVRGRGGSVGDDGESGIGSRVVVVVVVVVVNWRKGNEKGC